MIFCFVLKDYVEKCYKSVKEHRSELQNEYERLCGFAISFQDFMERQPKPKELLFEQGVMASMCQRNLLNLLDKITKNEEWMKVSMFSFNVKLGTSRYCPLCATLS